MLSISSGDSSSSSNAEITTNLGLFFSSSSYNQSSLNYSYQSSFNLSSWLNSLSSSSYNYSNTNHSSSWNLSSSSSGSHISSLNISSSSAIGVSSSRLSSSSLTYSSSISSSSSSSSVKVDFSTFNSNGFSGQYSIAAISDRYSGGSSIITDQSGVCLGNYLGCSNGNYSSAISSNGLNSLLIQNNYVASSASTWGWAQVGWCVQANRPTQPLGLINSSVLSVNLNYTSGDTLTLQLEGLGVWDSTNVNDFAPRYSII